MLIDDPDRARSIRRKGGLTRVAKHGAADLAAAGQRGLMDRFRAEVDPDGILPPAERERRAEWRRKAHMLELGMRSADARRARKGAA